MPQDSLVNRIRAEYLEMPGLQLNGKQVQRLCGGEPLECQVVLTALVETRFLCIRANGTYARSTDGVEVPRPRPAKAHIRTENCSAKIL
jgi:hypothetical protein